MLTHTNLVSNMRAAAEALDISQDDVALSFLPLCHVFERMSGHYLMLLKGATIAYAESVEQVPANMAEVRPTVMSSVPRLYEKMFARVHEKVAGDPPLRQKIFRWAVGVGRENFRHFVERTTPPLGLRLKAALADRLVFSKIKERTGGRLRLFVSGGAPLAREIAEFFGAAGLLILEGYGLTETSPVITVNRPDAIRPGSVGQPIKDVEVRIAADGEILTRGPHVMKGYFKKPEATAEAIDPEGWFHTGDIGVLDQQGFLTITDRKKEMIKYKGFGIAPAEIEALLFEHDGVADVAVIGKPDDEAGEVPKAFVVPKDKTLTRDALLAWARGRLAGYKALHDVELVDAIPKTASGKILRRVLKEQERQRMGRG
jgi:long-chain acyl-CoA synthetase